MNKMDVRSLKVYYATLFDKDGPYDLHKYKSWDRLRIGDTVRLPMRKERYCVTRISDSCVGNQIADFTLIERE